MGICDWDKDEASIELTSFIVYKFVYTIPLAVFSSYICITLTFRTFANLFDYMLRSATAKKVLIEKSKDSYFDPPWVNNSSTLLSVLTNSI